VFQTLSMLLLHTGHDWEGFKRCFMSVLDGVVNLIFQFSWPVCMKKSIFYSFAHLDNTVVSRSASLFSLILQHVILMLIGGLCARDCILTEDSICIQPEHTSQSSGLPLDIYIGWVIKQSTLITVYSEVNSDLRN